MPCWPQTTGRRPQIAQAAALGHAVVHGDDRVHALFLHLDPAALEAHLGAVVGGRVEIVGRAALALDSAQHGVALLGGGAAQADEVLEQAVHGLFAGGLDPHAHVGLLFVGAPDAEFLDLKRTIVGHDGVEHDFQAVRVDQVPSGLDYFVWACHLPQV